MNSRERGSPDHLVTWSISVIIPAHNEEEYLGATLEALHQQDHRWFETIVVANGCTDRTVGVARGACHRLVVLSEKSLGVARNLGARLAHGDLLVFLDADTILDPSALGTIARRFSRESAAGTVRGVPDSNRWQHRLLYGLKNFSHRWSLHGGSSGVIICWREHFEILGGFDEHLCVRENSDLIRRLRRFGRYQYVQSASATTSMRRYERDGFGRVTWFWLKIWWQSFYADLHGRRYETVR